MDRPRGCAARYYLNRRFVQRFLKHSQTLLSAYAHQQEILVREGDRVRRGQTIGRMGDTDSDRVKLHFEIREFGRPVDPLAYLPSTG